MIPKFSLHKLKDAISAQRQETRQAIKSTMFVERMEYQERNRRVEEETQNWLAQAIISVKEKRSDFEKKYLTEREVLDYQKELRDTKYVLSLEKYKRFDSINQSVSLLTALNKSVLIIVILSAENREGTIAVTSNLKVFSESDLNDEYWFYYDKDMSLAASLEPEFGGENAEATWDVDVITIDWPNTEIEKPKNYSE